MLIASGLYAEYRPLAHLHSAFPLGGTDTWSLKQPATCAGNFLYHCTAIHAHPLHLHGLDLNRHPVELIYPATYLDGRNASGAQNLGYSLRCSKIKPFKKFHFASHILQHPAGRCKLICNHVPYLCHAALCRLAHCKLFVVPVDTFHHIIQAATVRRKMWAKIRPVDSSPCP